MKKVFSVIFLLAIGVLFLAPPALAAGLVPCGGSPRCCETIGGVPETAHPNCGTSVLPASACCNTNCESRCTLCHIFVMIDRVMRFFLFTLVPPLAVLFVVIGGAYFIIGGSPAGGPGMLNQGKAVLTSVALGIIIIYGSWALLNTFFTSIGLVEWNGLQGGWFKINCPL